MHFARFIKRHALIRLSEASKKGGISFALVSAAYVLVVWVGMIFLSAPAIAAIAKAILGRSTWKI